MLACSALKASYRQTLTANLEGLKIVFLNGSRELIAGRMKSRKHFMPASLLESQLNTLEPPQDALVLDIGQPIEVMVRDVMAQLQLD